MKLPNQLPNLRGRWLTAYRILWALMFVGALSAFPLTISQQKDARIYSEEVYAFGLRGIASDGELLWQPISDHSATAPIIPGSRLVSVDGQVWDSDAPLTQSTAIFENAGDEAVLGLIDPDGLDYEVTVPRSPEYLAASDRATGISYRTRHFTQTGTTMLTFALALVVAVMLFRRKSSQPVPALLSLGLLAWMAQQAAISLHSSVRSDELVACLFLIAYASTGLAFLSFPSGKLQSRVALAGLVMLAAYLTAQSLFILGANIPKALSLTMVLPLMIAMIWANIIRYRQSEPEVRQQMKWGALGIGGLIVFSGIGIVVRLALPGVADPSLQGMLFFTSTILDFLTFSALLAGMLISLLRYRLYDAEAAIGNSAWVGTLTVSLLLIFAGSEKLFEVVGEQVLGEDMGIASGAIAAGLAAILAGPLYSRLHRWAERTFQRDMVRLRDGLPALIADLRETESPGPLATTALERIDCGVRAAAYALLFDDDGETVILATREVDGDALADWLATHGRPAEFPVTDREDNVFPERVPLRADGIDFEATLLVGRRSDGTLIGRDERKALAEIAEPLARALAVSLRRTRRIEHENAERSALKERIARLEQWIEGQGPKPDPA